MINEIVMRHMVYAIDTFSLLTSPNNQTPLAMFRYHCDAQAFIDDQIKNSVNSQFQYKTEPLVPGYNITVTDHTYALKLIQENKQLDRELQAIEETYDDCIPF